MQLICVIKTFTAAIGVRQQYNHNFTLFQTGDDFVVDIHACSEHSISGTNWFYLAVYSCTKTLFKWLHNTSIYKQVIFTAK